MMTFAPQGWFFIETQIDDEEPELGTTIIFACSKECAMGMWEHGPGDLNRTSPYPPDPPSSEVQHSDMGGSVVMSKPEKPKPPVEKVDLLPISRGVDKCLSYVNLEWDWETRFTWLVFGEGTLRTLSDRRDGRWSLEARMGFGITDPEHSTCIALRLPLVGVEFEWADHHQFRFHGYVDPTLDLDDHSSGFHVPPPGYDPRNEKGTHECSGVYDEKKRLYCKWNDKKVHVVVPEGFYVPKFNPALYKLVSGKRVEIIMGKSIDKTDG